MVVLTRLGPPEEGIRHREPRTKVYVNEKCLGSGEVFIAEARVSWVGGEQEGLGFSLEYPHVAMHAVQRAQPGGFPHGDNLYLIIDVRLVESDETPSPSSTPTRSGDEDDDDDGPGLDDDDRGMTEIRFVPEDAGRLQDMFKAMSDCQALHPDPADISDDEGGEGGDGDAEEEGMYDDAEEEDGGANGAGNGGEQEEPMEEDAGGGGGN